ncbi:aminobenzoyl-glutamate utilization protein B [Alteribacillus persepolensis]|uniref:Aminobenzoyl-glutamate utilization protein B n=1 Tax=Alteribacillus persepolensis TaxID=568899 RepID=A0A1G8GW72_9BACI|nr:amidohydrolase [Alteribacillus persepolensis]SDH98623.1 aminobenzoyl-glutamate utilization protein B [Alteribacillus persepolensis]
MHKQKIIECLNRSETEFSDMAQKIWEHPQIAYEETFACHLQSTTLKERGFQISAIDGMDTAFIAEYGKGTPIIGILGEYDALQGLSQKVSPVKEEVTPDGFGHGCGHNLLGTAGVEAVLALKEVMEKENLEGTIRYYGCPAEEVLSGKTFMARAGVFDDLDCALTWHPGTSNEAMNKSLQALVSVKFHFQGIPAHAAAAPHAGRSALDAAELMNTGANYLREHVLDGSRIHYTITNGGDAPNIVPEKASVWYFLRAANKKEVDHMLERLKKIAQGAALMTETEVSSDILASSYETLPNAALNDVMFQNMKEWNHMNFSDEEQRFAQALVQSIRSEREAEKENVLSVECINDKSEKGQSFPASTDVGDVSWITPTGSVFTTCAPAGVQLHSWQATASFGSTIGFKGMHLAARTMALSAYDLLQNEDIVAEAKKEFQISTKGQSYVPGIPNDVKPPALHV